MDLTKSGFKTTEFWLAVATITAGTLVILNKIDTYTYPAAVDIISKTLESITIIIAQSAIIYKYLHMRHETKMVVAEAKKEEKKVIIETTPEKAEKIQETLTELEAITKVKEN